LTYANFKRWLYQGNRPNLLAKTLNSFWAYVHSSGIAPDYLVTLEVIGRKSGRVISQPMVMVVLDEQRYVVSMLGEDARWVQNVRATDGKAAIQCGHREEVQLENVPVNLRAPILKLYLQRAPGARPHIPVNKDAPIAEFETIVADFPVFRVVSRTAS
jgi:hypothetical protein